MASPLKLASLWRVIRDIDVDAIRRSSLQRFELWVVSEDVDDGEDVRRLVSPPGEPHPWIHVRSPATIVPPLAERPLAALVVTRAPELSPAMTSARNALRAGLTPVMTIAIGQTGPVASLPRRGEDARVAVTSIDGTAVEPIGATLLALVDGDGRLALARQLTPLRRPLFQALIQETAQANATFALTTGLAETVPVLTAPLNLGDIVILTKNQLLLGYRIVLAAGRDGDPRTLLTEIVGVLGGGILFRQMARQLVGLIPVAGIVPKVAIAYSGTWAIGRALTLWVTEGQPVNAAVVQRMTAEGLGRGRAVAEALVRQAREARGRSGSRWERLRGYLPRRRSG